MSYSDQDPDKVSTLNEGPSVAVGTVVAGVAAGAVLMYLFNPRRGAARRAVASETLRQAGRSAGDSISDVVQDLGRRSAGVTGRGRARESLEPVAPDTDIDWSTSAHGRDVPTPPKPASAINRLVPAALGAMVSPKAGSVAALVQSLRDQTWNPKTRNTALLGGALSLYSIFAKRSSLTMGAGVVATALLAKGTQSAVAAANAIDQERAGTANAIHVERTIRIDASPEDVFDLWARYENFPRFMANVVEVRDLGADLSHWSVKGPGGSTFEWDSILTEKSRPHTLAWRSVPGAEVEQRGEVYLEPFRGGTRATVRMTYIPPAGKAGQALASLLGKNPKAQLTEDLERMKELLERGSLPDVAARTPEARSRFLGK